MLLTSNAWTVSSVLARVYQNITYTIPFINGNKKKLVFLEQDLCPTKQRREKEGDRERTRSIQESMQDTLTARELAGWGSGLSHHT